MEKQTVFIKRYPSKGELPKEDVWLDTNIGYVKFDTSDKKWLAIGGIVTWWLEEIELPSEEEIKSTDFKPKDCDYMEVYREIGFKDGIIFLIKHMKGENNGI